MGWMKGKRDEDDSAPKQRRRRRSIRYFAAGAVLVALLSSCCLMRQFGDAPTADEIAAYQNLPYFSDGVFRSPRPTVYLKDQVAGGKGGFIRHAFKSPNVPARLLPTAALDATMFPATPEDYAFYWLGHSSMIAELDGLRVLIDPVFGNAAPLPGLVRRYVGPPLARKALPPVDVVLISHNHYDHLEYATIRVLRNSDAVFVVPLGVGAMLRGWGVRPEKIHELGWGEAYRHGSVSFTAEKANHFSGRSFRDRDRTLWVSYVIETATKKIFSAAIPGMRIFSATSARAMARSM